MAIPGLCTRNAVCFTFSGEDFAYVGAGQVGDWPASEGIYYNFTLAEAQRRGKRRASNELRSIGRRIVREASWCRANALRVLSQAFAHHPQPARILRFRPEYAPGHVFFNLRDVDRGLAAKSDESSTRPAGASLLLGRYDRLIAPETSTVYFDMLTATSKTLVWFEKSAHEPPFEEPTKFTAAMAESVRRVVVASS